MGRSALRKTWIAGIFAALLAVLSAGLTPSVAADETCISVVQGLPGRTISVSIDGKTVVEGLAGGKVEGPFAVGSGTQTLTFTEGGKTLATSTVRLPAGSNSEIVLHLPASPTGDPVVTRFDNKLDAVQDGKAAHSVAHVAAAGPIDIRINENVVSANLANGEYTYKVVPAGTRKVDVVMTGRSDPMLGPFDNTLLAGKMTWLFVIGVPGQDLAVVRHAIALTDKKGGAGSGSERPAEVPTGTGGQAADLARR